MVQFPYQEALAKYLPPSWYVMSKTPNAQSVQPELLNLPFPHHEFLLPSPHPDLDAKYYVNQLQKSNQHPHSPGSDSLHPSYTPPDLPASRY